MNKEQARKALDNLKSKAEQLRGAGPSKAKAAIKAMRKEMIVTEEKLRRRATI